MIPKGFPIPFGVWEFLLCFFYELGYHDLLDVILDIFVFHALHGIVPVYLVAFMVELLLFLLGPRGRGGLKGVSIFTLRTSLIHHFKELEI